MPQLRVGICPGATPKVLQALNDSGIRSVTDFITSNLEEVAAKCSIPYKDLLSIRQVVLAQYSSFPVSGADMYGHLLSSVSILSTGSQSLNQLLDGGFYTGELTEIAGDVSSGKTQLCFTSAALVAMETQKTVLYIDTSGSFTAERIEEILHERDCKNIEAALGCIRCEQCFDIFKLLELIEEMRCHVSRKTDNFYSSLKLIVVDSVPGVISPVLGGQQSDGHALMTQMALKLRMISSEFSIAILVTNNLVGGDAGTPTVALGRTWQHSPQTRLLIQNQCGETKSANVKRVTLAKSSRLAVNIGTTVQITESGVEDVT